MKRKFFLNNKGQALALVLFAVVATVMATIFMMTQIYNADKNLRYPRVKGQQTIQKVRLNNVLNSPLVYSCSQQVSATQTCTLQATAIQSVLTRVKGCDLTGYTAVTGEIAPVSGGCGFSIRPVPGIQMLDYPTRQFNAVIHYMGSEVSLKDTPINFTIPGQLLTGDIALCPAATPQFRGFDGNGNAICQAFGTLSCAAGQFVSAVDPTSFQVTCQSYSSTATCDNTTFLANLTYSNGIYSGGCGARLNPFLYFGYNPEYSVSTLSFTQASGVGITAQGDYGYYDVGFVLAPPPGSACDSNTGPW